MATIWYMCGLPQPLIMYMYMHTCKLQILHVDVLYMYEMYMIP